MQWSKKVIFCLLHRIPRPLHPQLRLVSGLFRPYSDEGDREMLIKSMEIDTKYSFICTCTRWHQSHHYCCNNLLYDFLSLLFPPYNVRKGNILNDLFCVLSTDFLLVMTCLFEKCHKFLVHRFRDHVIVTSTVDGIIDLTSRV